MVVRASLRGFSLPELLFGLGVFSLFLVGMFALFGRGYQAYHFLSTRQSVQSDLLRLRAVLGDDFGKTHYRSVGSLQREILIDGDTVSRDIACCLSLDDWSRSENFRVPEGIPLWNRYIVYRSSLDNEGRLERLVVAPKDDPPFRVRPMLGLDNLEAPVKSLQTLSTSIRHFECRVDGYLQKVVVTLVLSDGGGKRGLDSGDAKETFKAEFSWLPHNTVPKL